MHSPRCVDLQNRLSHQNHVFMLAYPHHCPECDGLGVHISRYDPSASGVSLAYGGCFLEIEPCPSCLEKDRCPKCGESVDWLEYSDWSQEDHTCAARVDGEIMITLNQDSSASTSVIAGK